MSPEESIQQLRKELRTEDYTPPQLSESVKAALGIAARRLNSIRDERVRLTYMAAIVLENARLTAEVNDLRCRLGYPIIQTYEPPKTFGPHN